ncbi:MAG: response regulator [Bacteroidetes bacterium]|nr:response regulator [Bacteroidota bacterium]
MIIKSGNDPITILLVEDDEVDIINVKRAFKKNEIENQLLLANNGIEALKLLHSLSSSQLPQVILLDINMPMMNGIEFLCELRKDERLKHISVFVMTTSNEDSDKIEAYGYNVAGYILKPLSFDKFIDTINKLIEFWSITEFK